MYSPRLYKSRDSCVLKPTVQTFGTVYKLTHTLLVQTHTHDVSAPWGMNSWKSTTGMSGGDFQ